MGGFSLFFPKAMQPFFPNPRPSLYTYSHFIQHHYNSFMKKILFFLFLSSALFSCDKVDKVQPDNNTVPDAVLNAVKLAYPDASELTVVVLQQKKLYSVDFIAEKANYEAIVTEKGEMQELRHNAKTLDVSQNIQSYLDTHFPNATLDQVMEDLDPQDKSTIMGYWVYITTSDSKYYQLYFNDLGGFVSQMEITNTTSNDYKYSVTQADLPTSITDYLNTNNSGYTFLDGWALVMNNVTSYYISINYNNLIYYYEFDANGTVLSSSSYDPNGAGTNPGGGTITSETLVDASQIPTTIVGYLDQNFAGWQFQKGVVESDNGAVTRYYLVIMVGADGYYVEFNGNMQFVGAMHF